MDNSYIKLANRVNKRYMNYYMLFFQLKTMLLVILAMKVTIVMLSRIILTWSSFVNMEKPWFLGCEDLSILSFLFRMMHMKVICKMTNVAIDMILQFLNNKVIYHVNFPKNYYGAKKYLCMLGLGYESINNEVIYHRNFLKNYYGAKK